MKPFTRLIWIFFEAFNAPHAEPVTELRADVAADLHFALSTRQVRVSTSAQRRVPVHGQRDSGAREVPRHDAAARFSGFESNPSSTSSPN